MNNEEYNLRLEGFISELIKGITKTFAKRGIADVLAGFESCCNPSEFLGCDHTELNVVTNICLEAEEIFD